MKTFKQLMEGLDEMRHLNDRLKSRSNRPRFRDPNYVQIGGDRYDGGVVVDLFLDGSKADHQILDADDDYTYQGRTYGDLDAYIAAVAKANRLNAKDIKIHRVD